MRFRPQYWGFLVAAFSALASVEPVGAQEPLVRNDFNVESVTGPVLGSGRIVGLGGAYSALATGVDGAPWNPASFGSRDLWEVDWFEYDLHFGLMLPGRFSSNDFFNNGQGEGMGVEEFLFLDLGLRLQFGRFGVGGVAHSQSYVVRDGDRSANVTLLTGNYGVAWMFLDGQLVVGLGARTARLQLSEGGAQLVDFLGTGPEMGAVLRIEGQPWRLGVAGRTTVESEAPPSRGVMQDGGINRAGAFVLPNRVYLPWEVQVGFAWQFGRRPLNKKWTVPANPVPALRQRVSNLACERELEQLRREVEARGEALGPGDRCPTLARRPTDPAFWREELPRRSRELEELEEHIGDVKEAVYLQRAREYEQLARHYWLVSAEALLVGPSPDAIGIDAFIDQQRRRAGRDLTLGLRVGVETEPWLHRLKVRVGSYLEPSRNQGVPPRLHGTFGFDVRLFTWDLFGLVSPFTIRIGATADIAPRYVDFGVGIGFWH